MVRSDSDKMPSYTRSRLIACSLFLALLLGALFQGISAQPTHTRERLRGVLSLSRLAPPLRGDATIRLSPDGEHLFLQDASGIMLVSRHPLRLVSYLETRFSYSARFSGDSQSIHVVSHDLLASTWRVSDGKKIESHDLSFPGGCLSASLSPTADLLACYTPEQDLVILRTDTGQKVFSSSIHPHPSDRAIVPILLDTESAFPAPFGFILSNNTKPLANRGLIHYPLWFSPDGEFLLAGDNISALRVNLSTFSRENLPSAVHKRMHAVVGVLRGEQTLVYDTLKQEPPAIVSLSTGQTVATPPLPAGEIALATDTRFAIIRKRAGTSVQVFDVQNSRLVPLDDCIAADVSENVLVALDSEGTLKFFRAGESEPFEGARLLLGELPPLRAASVSPSLDLLSIAVDGAAGTFSSATGVRKFSTGLFAAAFLEDSRSPLFLSPRKFKARQEVMRPDYQTGAFASAWTAAEGANLHPNGNTLLAYSLYEPEFRVRRQPGSQMIIDMAFVDVPYRLDGLDPASGSKWWDRGFNQGVPIPFADPQGDRFILAWKARSDGAKEAVKRVPAIHDLYKKSKVAEQDTVFEVRDSRTGKSLGSVLVQFGGGPIDFGSASSVGDALFLVKDEIRLSVFSLKDGRLILRRNGLHPTANAESSLLALDEGGGHLGIYDLSSGAKIEEQLFPDLIAYTHFSADGKKLLALTQHQVVYILDMSQVREHPLAPEPPIPAPSDSALDNPQ